LNLRGRNFVVLSMTFLLCSCAASNSDYNSRFFEKYLLDGERAMQENDFERAERMFRFSVAHGEKLGSGDWRLALAEGRLGKVLAINHKEAEAKTVLNSAVANYRTAKPGKQSSINLIAKERGEADSLLGSLLVDSGDVNGARSYLEEASALLAPFWSAAKDEPERDTISGIGYARALYGLARIRQKIGDDKEAKEYYENALAVIDEERISVPLRDDIAQAFSNFLKSKGKGEKSAEVEEKQEEYARFNPGGPKAIARDAWRQSYNKAREASKDGKLDESNQLYEEAVKQVNVYEKEGEDAFQTLCEWARVRQKMNDSEGADRLLTQAEAMAIRMGGKKSVWYDNYLMHKVKVLKFQHKYEELEAMLKQQVALREELRGKDNFHVGETLRNLSTCRYHLNKVPEAEADMRRAIEIFKKNPQRNYKELKDSYDDFIPMLEKSEKVEDVRKFKFDRAVLVKDTIKWESEKHQR
jgi:tetratricopeptide (TPR) repeat protein